MAIDIFRAQANPKPACTQAPDLFFSDDPDDIAHAKAICGQCPLAAACRELIRDTGEPYGVWAGTTPEERGTIAYENRRKARRAQRTADRRAQVVDLCRRMTPGEAAEALGIPVKIVYDDRSKAGASRAIRSYAEVVDDVVQLRSRGVSVPNIAAELHVSDRTVTRWLRKQRMEAAA